jgi:hypothetical protein
MISPNVAQSPVLPSYIRLRTQSPCVLTTAAQTTRLQSERFSLERPYLPKENPCILPSKQVLLKINCEPDWKANSPVRDEGRIIDVGAMPINSHKAGLSRNTLLGFIFGKRINPTGGNLHLSQLNIFHTPAFTA